MKALRIAIISDTHLPRGQRGLPHACIERLRASDLIIHAGDLIALSVLAEIESFAPVVAVHGNVDQLDVREALPPVAVVEPGGVRIGVIHDAGAAAGRLQRMRNRFPHAAAVVFGHSHLPLHEISDDGFQIFNPGSPTERRRAPAHTMGVATVSNGRVDFELLRVDDRFRRLDGRDRASA